METTIEEAPVRAEEDRELCGRCSGYRRLFSELTNRHTGPRCPDCAGRGLAPRRIGPHRAFVELTDPSLAELVARLRKAGREREEWRTARGPGSTERRAEIKARIKGLHAEAITAGLRIVDIAEALGLSRQALDVLLKGKQR